ncbi:MAG: DUF499 domain-containing protein [Conexivisphaera sp.]
MTIGDAIKSGRLVLRDYVDKAARTGGIDDRLFSVDLSKAGSVDAGDFFDRTELVRNLGELITRILGRISGFGGHDTAVFLLDTVMGGGKSHSLVYLYLLFTRRSVANARPEVKKILGTIGLDAVPDAEVVTFDGMNADSSVPFKDQPGISRFFEGSDSKDDVRRRIEAIGKPLVFLMDEMLVYLSKSQATRPGGWTSDLAFMRTLAEAVADTETSVFVATAPSDTTNQDGYNRLVNVFKEMKRVAMIIHPQNPGEDFARIARRQIFKRVDEGLAREAAEWARGILGRNGLPIDSKFEDSYPFHPMLIDVFTRRLPEFANFQKTREALKLLARAVAVVYAKGGALSIMGPSDVDLGDGYLRAELTSSSIFEMGNLDTIVSSDVLPVDGLSRRAATAIYLYSLYPREEQRGLDKDELFEALLPENNSPSDLRELMRNYVRERAFYMEENGENGKFYFKEEVNIHAVVRREAAKVGSVDQELMSVVGEFAAEFGPDFNPTFGAIELRQDELNLVFAPLSVIEDDRAMEYANEKGLFSTDSPANAVVLIYPSQDASVSELELALRQNVAVEGLKKVYSGDKRIGKKLANISDELHKQIISNFVACYRRYLMTKDKKLMTGNFAPKESNENAYAGAVKEELVLRQKAYFSADAIDVEVLFRKLLGERSEMRAVDAYSNIAMSSVLPYLPRRVFIEALRAAASRGVVGMARASEPERLLDQPLSNLGEMLILSPERVKQIRGQEGGSKPGVVPGTLKEEAIQAVSPGSTAPISVGDGKVKERRYRLSVSPSIKDVKAALALLDYAENEWRLAAEKDGAACIELQLLGEGGAHFSAPMAKSSKIRALVSAFSSAFGDEERYGIKVSVCLREDLVRKLQGKIPDIAMSKEEI